MLKSIINSSLFYFLLPPYLALLLLLTFFYVPTNFYFGLAAYYIIISLPILLASLLFPLNMKLQDYYAEINQRQQYKHIIFFTCLVIALYSPLDIYVNGFKLLHPASYAEFNGIGRHIRHITILCWLFIPVAFIFTKNTWLKILLCSYALLFPIIILDRNRLFLSCYTFFLCYIFSNHSSYKKKIVNVLAFILILFLIFITFSSLGFFRSGNMLLVSSSDQQLIQGAYPLHESISSLPLGLQQIILYITTPLFNFATIVAANFFNPEFLLSQFSPFSRENFYPIAPIIIPRFNVGTEFYSFLLYGGLPLVIVAYIFFLVGFIFSVLLLKKYPNIFTFLIFIKISYCAIFMNFAPQYYMLLNLMFCLLMLFLWSIAESLNYLVRGDLK